MNFKWVASKYEISSRKENLSFGHHLQVAALQPVEADRLLARAADEGLSTRELRQMARAGPLRPGRPSQDVYPDR
jgi:hypothetical protein